VCGCGGSAHPFGSVPRTCQARREQGGQPPRWSRQGPRHISAGDTCCGVSWSEMSRQVVMDSSVRRRNSHVQNNFRLERSAVVRLNLREDAYGSDTIQPRATAQTSPAADPDFRRSWWGPLQPLSRPTCLSGVLRPRIDYVAAAPQVHPFPAPARSVRRVFLESLLSLFPRPGVHHRGFNACLRVEASRRSPTTTSHVSPEFRSSPSFSLYLSFVSPTADEVPASSA